MIHIQFLSEFNGGIAVDHLIQGFCFDISICLVKKTGPDGSIRFNYRRYPGGITFFIWKFIEPIVGSVIVIYFLKFQGRFSNKPVLKLLTKVIQDAPDDL